MFVGQAAARVLSPISLVFRPTINRHQLTLGGHDGDDQRPAAHAAILNVFLISSRAIDDDFDPLAAARALKKRGLDGVHDESSKKGPKTSIGFQLGYKLCLCAAGSGERMLVYETKKTAPNAEKKSASRTDGEAKNLTAGKTSTGSAMHRGAAEQRLGSSEDSKVKDIGVNASVFAFVIGMAKTSCLGLAAHPLLAGCLAIAGAAGFIYFAYFF